MPRKNAVVAGPGPRSRRRSWACRNQRASSTVGCFLACRGASTRSSAATSSGWVDGEVEGYQSAGAPADDGGRRRLELAEQLRGVFAVAVQILTRRMRRAPKAAAIVGDHAMSGREAVIRVAPDLGIASPLTHVDHLSPYGEA